MNKKTNISQSFDPATITPCKPQPPTLQPQKISNYNPSTIHVITNKSHLDDSEDEPLSIPNIGGSVSEAFRNVEKEAQLITGCNVDMATLKLFVPQPLHRNNQNQLQCQRVLKAFIIGYFQAAFIQSLIQIKMLRQQVINISYNDTVCEQLVKECPQIKQNPKSINKLFIQFIDMLSSMSVEKIFSEYAVIDRVVEVVLLHILKQQNVIKPYQDLNKITLDNFLKYCGVLGKKLGIQATMSGNNGAKVQVEGIAFTIRFVSEDKYCLEEQKDEKFEQASTTPKKSAKQPAHKPQSFISKKN